MSINSNSYFDIDVHLSIKNIEELMEVNEIIKKFEVFSDGYTKKCSQEKLLRDSFCKIYSISHN